jgi:hypothetical protein
MKAYGRTVMCDTDTIVKSTSQRSFGEREVSTARGTHDDHHSERKKIGSTLAQGILHLTASTRLDSFTLSYRSQLLSSSISNHEQSPSSRAHASASVSGQPSSGLSWLSTAAAARLLASSCVQSAHNDAVPHAESCGL